MNVTLVDTTAAIVALLDCLEGLPTHPPSLYLDIEGVRLSRNGSISIIQLLVQSKSHIFLIDVHVLQEKAFDTPNTSGSTLKSVLESKSIAKVFFDVRNDTDALYGNYEVSMQCLQDVQLLECATRSSRKIYVKGLATCIEEDKPLTPTARNTFKATKQIGRALFATEQGGSYEVFNERPLRKEIMDYCTQDVVYLPLLWKIYTNKISTDWALRFEKETLQRLLMAQDPSTDPDGLGKTMSPWVNEDYAQYALSQRSSLRRFWAPESWTCEVCDRDMQLDQRQDHLAGRAHAARLNRINSRKVFGTQTCAQNGGFIRFDANAIPWSFLARRISIIYGGLDRCAL